MRCKLLNERAVMPKQSKEGDAGYDLVYCGDTDVKLQTGTQHGFETGVAVEIPYGWVGIVKPRSGKAVEFGLDVLAGVIDSNYRGEVIVILSKATTKGGIATIKPGDKVAQLVVVPCKSDKFEVVDRLTGTMRGDKGFGSSGS